MLVADLADLLQIAFRRDQRAGRSGNRLDEDSRQRATAKILGDALEIHGHFGAGLRLALGEALLFCPGVADHRDVRQGQAEGLAVADHAGKRHATHIHAVIGALAADQAVTLRMTAGTLIGQDDLDRRVDRFRSGIGEEHMVEFVRQHPADTLGQLERPGVAKLEMRSVVIVQHLVIDRLGDLATAMAGRGAEQRRRAVNDLAALVIPHIHAFGLDDDARVLLEIAVCGKRHPVRFKRVHVVGHPCLLRCLRRPVLAPRRLDVMMLWSVLPVYAGQASPSCDRWWHKHRHARQPYQQPIEPDEWNTGARLTGATQIDVRPSHHQPRSAGRSQSAVAGPAVGCRGDSVAGHSSG